MKQLIIGVVVLILFGFGVAAVIDSNASSSKLMYSARPLITVRNWTGSEVKIKFPYQEDKYFINYESPFEYAETENGYDLTIHFIRKEK